MTSYCCQWYAGNDFVFQQDSAPAHRARATVELLRQETPNFLASNLWPPSSPDLSPVHYVIWAVVQCRVDHWQIHSVSELKRRLIDVWCGLEQSIFDEAIDQWQEILPACVHVEGEHFKYSLWIDNVDFVHICYIQCDLFDCCIFHYEIVPATLTNTFLFILQGRLGSVLANFRHGGRFRVHFVIVIFCLQQWKNY